MRRLVFDIPDELHTKLKVHVARENITIKDYIISLLKEELEEDE